LGQFPAYYLNGILPRFLYGYRLLIWLLKIGWRATSFKQVLSRALAESLRRYFGLDALD